MTSFLRAIARSVLALLADFDAPLSPAGWQPRLEGPAEPPRAPAGWAAPAGAINPITQRPFAS